MNKDNPIQKILNLLDNSDSAELPMEEIRRHLSSIQKQSVRSEFKLQRFIKDKEIAVKLLNESIAQLQGSKEDLESKNELLQEKNEAINQQHAILEKQQLMMTRQAKKLEQQYEELERNYQEMEQFAYIASHDLKSPLRTISNFAQLLKRRYGGKLDENADEYIDFIVNGIFRMNNIIDDLLNYSSIDKKENPIIAVDLNEVLEVVRLNLTDIIQGRKAEIISDPLPVMNGIRSGMIQLFQNLVGNAIKFCPDDRIPEVTIRCTEQKGHWLITVSDNGIGISEGYEKKLFQPFQRLENNNRPGTGIGLAICKKVVELHLGSIWYDSIEGKGTNFHLTLSRNLSDQQPIHIDQLIGQN